MIKTIVHYSDLHLKLYKHHQRDKNILKTALNEWKEIKPDRIVFTGDLVHSKNQMTPELIRLLSWWMTETAKICPTIYLIGNHDFLENNQDRLDAITPIVENLNNNDNEGIVTLRPRQEFQEAKRMINPMDIYLADPNRYRLFGR